ncbi:Mak16 protein [Polyplosphaeria fusca]|uniref:Protein MAK16 n=1 Tax=Polyplosphaeria fusca TaxID=682080 RepID=A0A9P4UX26_9PLEO|nr:Mak16 protein [Polyplosphaeria fusca]
MASDDLVWNIIGTDFCSYKIKTSKDQTFCRNENNLTGLCSRQACPLANSRYATIRSDAATGNIYLYLKEAERSHLPNKWWEKIKLSGNYVKALEQVDRHLMYHSKFISHKCKQRLTRLTQVRLRVNRLEKETERLGERLVPRLAPKVRQREEGRERKALAAAKLEKSIERVLIERLRSGAYGNRPLNVEPNVWERVLNGLEKEGEALRDADLDEGVEEENEYEEERGLENEGVADVEYVSDIDGESEDDMEDFEDWLGGQSPDEDEGGDSESGSEESGDSEDDDDEAKKLKKTLASLKRKRPSGPPSKSKKAAKNPKGARVGLEYVVEAEAEAPKAQLA